MTIVPLLFISPKLLGRATTTGATIWSLVYRAFTRSWRVGVRGKLCALGVRFGGSVGRVAVVFVTLFVSWDVCVKYTIVGL